MRNRPYVAVWSFVVLQPLALDPGTKRIVSRRAVTPLRAFTGRRSCGAGAWNHVVRPSSAGET